MSEKLYDVIVVGAGPGGSAAAIILAGMGWEVLLLDKAVFPRDKVCGDFISPRSLRVLYALGCWPALQEASPNRVESASLYLNGELLTAGVIPQVEHLPNYGYTLPRTILDEIVFRQAQSAGVETIEGCEIKDILIGEDFVMLQAEHDGNSRTFSGRLAIGADGARSTIGQILGMERGDSKSIILALRAYYKDVDGDPSEAAIFFDESYFPGYAWIFPLANGRANVGLGMMMNVYQRYHLNLRERFIDWIENDPFAQARLSGAKADGRILGWPLTTYRTRGGNYAERVLIIGDAGNFVDPLNGEGIHTALETARIAAEVADEALQAEDFSQRFLSRYEQRWRAALDLDLRTSNLIITITENRSLARIWLLILKMISQSTQYDSDYAATCGGILSGVVPTHHSLSPKIAAKTLLQYPVFWQYNLGLSFDEGVSGLVNSGFLTASDAFDAVSEMAQQPAQTVEWGLDVATKGLGVLTGLSHKYLERN